MQTDALILRAAKGLKVERTPVWVMRQAGRILPEYRAIRASLSGFKELVETPALAAEVSKQPVDILGVDAAIIFSDIFEINQYILVYKITRVIQECHRETFPNAKLIHIYNFYLFR